MPDSADLLAAWTDVRADLQEDPRVSPQQMAFVRLSRPIGLIDDTALFAVPDDLTKQMFESRLREPIAELLSTRFSQSVRLAVTVDPDAAAVPDETPGRGPRPAQPPRSPAPRTSPSRARRSAAATSAAPPVRATRTAASSRPG